MSVEAKAHVLLLHGAASTGWLWYRVAARLEDAGHATVAPDLPCADPEADLDTYIAVATRAAEEFDSAPVTIVAQSMAGRMAPVIAAQRPVECIVLVAAMISRPGEREWTGGRPPTNPKLNAAISTNSVFPNTMHTIWKLP